ncbi:MAG: hypothetical protein SFU86_25770 [Pirellulaceae bacterium]|nr:hypothetical protein [Pirellulaceae bacterium]
MPRKAKTASNQDDLGRIIELRMEAWGLPACPTKVALLEEAVRIADLHNDIDEGYDLRQDLMEAATFCGRDDVLLVAFAWCLGQFDRDPERFDEWDLLWKYKWVAVTAPDFPTISRAQIEAMLADLQRRFEAAGHSLHAVHQHRRDVLAGMNDVAGAREAHKLFARARRDRLSDCPACVQANTGSYYELLADWKRVWKSYAKIAEGTLRCHVEPLRSTSAALIPLLRLGERDKAIALQTQAARLLPKAEEPARAAAKHVAFLAIIGETAKAKRIFERYLPVVLASVAPLDRFNLFIAGWLLLDRLAAKGPAVKLQLPPPFPPADDKGRREIASLRDWLWREAEKIAAQFDARNQNNGYAQELARAAALLDLAAN